MCIDTAAWYQAEWACPPQDSECKQYSVSAQCCTEADELTQVLWEYTCAASRAQDSASSQCSPVPCGHLGFFGVSVNILNASLPLAVWGGQNSFFHWTDEGVGGAALASCKHLGVPLFFYLKVFHFSFEVAITVDQLISSSVEGICEGCLKALASFCPTVLRAQCNVLLVKLMVIVATKSLSCGCSSSSTLLPGAVAVPRQEPLGGKCWWGKESLYTPAIRITQIMS